jgi:diguanylate cyclase (GGDEF)-like protein
VTLERRIGKSMRVDRRVLIGGAALVGSLAVVSAVTQLLPPGSTPRTTLADVYMPLLELCALVLTCLALRKNAGGPYRWTWLFLTLWVAANLFADIVWGWYEVGLHTPVPSPSIADFGYLISYPLGFLTVIFATWKASGRLRTVESSLDAMMLTLGIAGLGWPLLLAPLFESSPHGVSGLISLAYPLGDLLVVVAFASLLLSSLRQRPPRFLLVIWAAFLIQVVADSVYFSQMMTPGGYTSGGALDSTWAGVFALAGIAALMGMLPATQGASAGAQRRARLRSSRPQRPELTYPRMLLPYLAVPTAGALIWAQFARFGAVWSTDMQVLVYIGIGLVALLVMRQFVTLLHNRRLNAGLSDLSRQLNDRVQSLAGVTERLEELNAGAIRLNSLRALSEIMQGGLELACSVTRSPAAWIALKDDGGTMSVAARFGQDEMLPAVGSAPDLIVPTEQQRLDEVELEVRGEKIGSLWLVKPVVDEQGPGLVRAVGAQLATAIDNTRRYEEVLRLAERDPLTGLFNHRGIHQRLAVEGRRAQQRGGMLSLVMIDLDDFKLLNDTYGHPAGDRVLSRVSEAIRDVLRHTDLAGRVGGDEMMLVLPNTDRAGAMQMAERLREALSSKPFVAGKNRGIPLRISLGVATYPADADTLTGLVGVADASLYASKQRGGNTITEAGTTEEPPVEATGLRGIAGRLMDVVGARDHYTRRHSDQVTVHALELGQSLGLPDESLETLKLAAMLHDVGKLGMGPRVLRKPAPLTIDEERSVRRHIDIGEMIIRDLPRVTGVLEAVHAHHERYDGTGYPAGLFGEDIPLLARILAIADAYAAMTIDRPYRSKLTPERARLELLKVSGSQLDPELVGRFVETLKNQAKDRFAAAG